jgi:hypothetical protein
MEGGYRLGRWRHIRAADETDASVAPLVAALLGLLAFILTFTFSLAGSRFDARRQAVYEEANSIGTTYLRARLLPEPQRSKAVQLLRDYVRLRVELIAELRVKELLTLSEKFHQELWAQAVAAAERDPRSIPIGLFLQSLNETIDLHAKREFLGLRNRIPFSMWLVLFSLTALGMASVGYLSGLAGAKRSPEMPILTVAFAAVLFLIVDLDRGYEGLLKVSQQSMIDLERTMQADSPAHHGDRQHDPRER